MSVRNLYLCTPGFEAPLLSELSRPSGANGGVLLPGVVWTAPDNQGDKEGNSDATYDPVFARQSMPAAQEIKGPSIARLADGLFAACEGTLDASTRPFVIHAVVPPGSDPSLGSRIDLIASELSDRLKERRRRTWRRMIPTETATQTFAQLGSVVQLLMTERESAWISTSTPQARHAGGWNVALWPGGVAPVADDRAPPSRAYRKLEEAFQWLEDEPRPGQLCVDLGASPGGWTYTALKRGARVVAVDRAPLESPVREHSLLTMIEGNAFTFDPAAAALPRVDWLLSDVICEPARSLALMEQWISKGWCHRLVVTVKFKGQSGYGILDDVRALLVGAGCPRWRIKHLHHNKNEVTTMAVVYPPETA